MSAEETESENALVLETQALMAISEEQRFEYVKGVLESLAAGLMALLKEKTKIKQAKMAQQLFQELDEKSITLMPPIIYTIKPEFQPVYIKLLQELAETVKP